MRFVRMLLSLTAAGAAAVAAAPSNVTYTKQVARILNSRCVECHRAGEAAPMAFTSYKEARPWAKAIREAVLTKRMPPWLADPAFGHFANDRRLAQDEVDTITQWVAAGAPEGEGDPPAPPVFETGWTIGKPDRIVDMGVDFDVPTSGVVPYRYFTVDPGFTEDTWVEAAEIRPDKRSVVHHVIVFLQDPKEPQLAGTGGNLLVGWAPGSKAAIFHPGTAKLIRAGTKFRFQMHYTPNGQPATDRSYIGLRFAKTPVTQRALTGRALNLGIRIPPHEPAHEVKSSWTARTDTRILGLMPHMHLRGKDFKYTVVYPDGRDEVILSVPRYDFNWQLSYELTQPLVLPAGSRIDCVAHFDNSANNKYNPDPTKEVKWGDQTWEEMMIGWFTYTAPAEPVQVSAAANN